MGKRSKNKGANYERRIAKILSDWSGLDLRRTPMSGGWSKQNPDVAGDLVNITPGTFFPYHIECKNQEVWTWEGILTGNCVAFDSWWEQTTTQCHPDKIPFLIFSKNYHEDWTCTYVKKLESYENFNIKDKLSKYVIINDKIIFSLREYLEVCMYARKEKDI